MHRFWAGIGSGAVIIGGVLFWELPNGMSMAFEGVIVEWSAGWMKEDLVGYITRAWRWWFMRHLQGIVQ